MRTTPILAGLVLAIPLVTPAAAQVTSRPTARNAASKPAAGSCDSRIELDKIWQQLRQRHDKNGDGEITKTEFSRGVKQFRNHDRNRDGVINAADYPKDRFWNSFGSMLTGRADADHNKVLTKAEWQTFIAMIDTDRNGVMTMQEFGKIMPPHLTAKPKLLALSFDQNGNGKIEASDFHSLFGDLDWNNDGKLDGREMARNEYLGKRDRKAKAPKVGMLAPDFDLPLVGEKQQTIRLSSFRGKKPVALIFGSYT